ncbi:DUF1302 domain-containing protein [Oleomonas cavernae]|nr:DUF1302 family protein [Oleomonas cavernae]
MKPDRLLIRARPEEPSQWRAATRVTQAAALVLATAGAATAYDFEVGDEVTGSIVTSLSVGVQLRVADRDPRVVGQENGGAAVPAVADDGDLNFDKYDVVNQLFTATSEMKLRWREYFATISGTAFLDTIAMNNDLAENGPESRPYRGRYSPPAKDEADWDIELRELYVGGNFTLFDRPLTLKVGNQILNWGEALFTLNGISVINGFDVSKLLTPGTEFKDALIPMPLATASYQITDNLSAEAFYGFGFEPIRVPACGAFLSFSDIICEGVEGTSIVTDYGDTRSYTVGRDNARDYDNPPYPLGTGPQAISLSVPILKDDDLTTNDYGVSIRYFAPELNNTEFSFYYAKYRSRLPSVYFRTPEVLADGTGEADLLRVSRGLLGSALGVLG